MYLLHIETSTLRGSVTLSREDEKIDSLDLNPAESQTGVLVPAIQTLMERSGLVMKDLAGVSVSSGPGSYTGLRVGGATAKGISYSLNIPLIGIPTLYILAWSSREVVPEARWYIPLLDARKMEVYTTYYNIKLEASFPVSSAILDEGTFRKSLPDDGLLVFSGDGSLKLPGSVTEGLDVKVLTDVQCHSDRMVGPAWERFRSGQFEGVLHFVPDYVKPPNITQQKSIWGQ